MQVVRVVEMQVGIANIQVVFLSKDKFDFLSINLGFQQV